ncbi:RING-H2 finger protein ATL8-like protein [Carex littledalei]|uniref:RING-H2 finger protein ATL8-like protein n=1 Tax=Carex littledalei TaxID=544730 RepID=A0A833RIC4_9POAL|nr:RING-H2 finger protein ATL8-like protein [Carex littledalei]
MRLLLETSTSTSPSNTSTNAPPTPSPLPIDSDIVVILATLLCALISVVGLSLVVRCAFVRRHQSATKPIKQKGLNKKSLQSLPTLSFSSGCQTDQAATISGECAICLGEFAEGERIRVLPPCGHGFHVACIDMWLGTHSSCPSCRCVPVVPAAPPSRCHKCGETTSTIAAVKSSNDAEDSSTGVVV